MDKIHRTYKIKRFQNTIHDPRITTHESRITIFPIQQRAEIFKRPVGGLGALFASSWTAPVLRLMAISAQQLPVAAVGRVVIVIAVPMVDFEQLQVRMRELPRAPAADPRIELERLLAVTLRALRLRAPGVRDNAVQPAGIGC